MASNDTHTDEKPLPLHDAVKRLDVDEVESLLQLDAIDVNAFDSEYTALHWAANFSDNYSAPTRERDPVVDQPNAPVQGAISASQNERSSLDTWPSPVESSVSDLRRGDFSGEQLALQQGASSSSVYTSHDRGATTAFASNAMSGGGDAIFRADSGSGAAPPLTVPVEKAPLTETAEKALRNVKMLIARGADIRATSVQHRETPLHLACSSVVCPAAIVRLLLDEVTIHSVTANFSLPHHYAAEGSNVAALEMLFDFEREREMFLSDSQAHSVAYSTLNRDGGAALDLVFARYSAAVLRDELKLRDNNILSGALYYGFLKSARFLLDNGVHPYVIKVENKQPDRSDLSQMFTFLSFVQDVEEQLSEIGDQLSGGSVSNSASGATAASSDPLCGAIQSVAADLFSLSSEASGNGAEGVTRELLEAGETALNQSSSTNVGVIALDSLRAAIQSDSADSFPLAMNYLPADIVRRYNTQPCEFGAHPIVEAIRCDRASEKLRALLKIGFEHSSLFNHTAFYSHVHVYELCRGLKSYDAARLSLYDKVGLLSHAVLTLESDLVLEDVLRQLLDSGANPNASRDREMPPLVSLVMRFDNESRSHHHQPAIQYVTHEIAHGRETIWETKDDALSLQGDGKSVFSHPGEIPFVDNPSKSTSRVENIINRLLASGADPYCRSSNSQFASPDLVVLSALLGSTPILEFLLSKIGFKVELVIEDLKSYFAFDVFQFLEESERYHLREQICLSLRSLSKFAIKSPALAASCKELDRLCRLTSPTLFRCWENTVHAEFASVDRLKEMCRKIVRRALVSSESGVFLVDKIQDLPVPGSIKTYLLYTGAQCDDEL